MYVFHNFLEKEDGEQQYMTIGIVSISKEMIKKKKEKKLRSTKGEEPWDLFQPKNTLQLKHCCQKASV